MTESIVYKLPYSNHYKFFFNVNVNPEDINIKLESDYFIYPHKYPDISRLQACIYFKNLKCYIKHYSKEFIYVLSYELFLTKQTNAYNTLLKFYLDNTQIKNYKPIHRLDKTISKTYFNTWYI